MSALATWLAAEQGRSYRVSPWILDTSVFGGRSLPGFTVVLLVNCHTSYGYGMAIASSGTGDTIEQAADAAVRAAQEAGIR